MSAQTLPPEHSPAELPPAPVANISLELGDIVVGLTLVAVAAWFFIASYDIPDFSGTSIGAADVPRGLAVLLALGSLGLIGAAAWRLASSRPGPAMTVRRPLRVATGAALLAAFPVLMSWAGYYPAMAVFLAAFLYLADYRKPVPLLIVVVGFLAFTKVVFEMILQTPLP